jgi:hypothetical protein
MGSADWAAHVLRDVLQHLQPSERLRHVRRASFFARFFARFFAWLTPVDRTCQGALNGRRGGFQGIDRIISMPGRAQYRNSGNMKELVKPLKTYKGYEIHPLIYPRGARDGGAAVRAADTGYEASVRIRRAPPAGEEATGESRVFRIEQTGSFENGGQARRACLLHAEKLIDGQIDGQTVADL